MKKFLLIFLVISFVYFTGALQNTDNDIIGKWNLIQLEITDEQGSVSYYDESDCSGFMIYDQDKTFIDVFNFTGMNIHNSLAGKYEYRDNKVYVRGEAGGTVIQGYLIVEINIGKGKIKAKYQKI